MPFPKKSRDEDDDFEIADIENWRGDPDLKYSHELLVMEQYRRCLKAGSQEMKKGWEERKVDARGNTMEIKTHPDTRKEFAECVFSMKNLLIGDITADEDAKEKIDELLEALKDLEEKYKDMEKRAWEDIPKHVKREGSNWMNRWEHLDTTLNYDYIYGEKYLQESIWIYRQILEEIGLLLHRMGYFTAKRTGE